MSTAPRNFDIDLCGIGAWTVDKIRGMEEDLEMVLSPDSAEQKIAPLKELLPFGSDSNVLEPSCPKRSLADRKVAVPNQWLPMQSPTELQGAATPRTGHSRGTNAYKAEADDFQLDSVVKRNLGLGAPTSPSIRNIAQNTTKNGPTLSQNQRTFRASSKSCVH